MPEPVELRVCGVGDRRVPVAEPDDGDPAAEIEVLAPLGVPDAAPSPRTIVTSARA